MNEVEIRVGSLDKSKPGLESAAKNVGGVRRAVLDLESAQIRTAKAQGSATTALQRYGAESMQARDAAAKLARAEYDQEQATSKLADEHRKASAQMDSAGRSAKDLVKDLAKVDEKAAGASSGLSSMGKDIAGALKGGLKSGIAGLGVVALAGGLAVGALLVKGIKQTLDAQDATAKLKVQLGLTAAQSKAVGALAGRLYAQAYGENMEQVNAAIRSVIQNGAVLHGTMSSDLQDVSGKVLNLANTFEQDLGGTTRAVGQMIRTGLAKDGAQALDILTRGFQTGGDKAEDLLDTFNEYPTQLRKLGLDGAAAMGLISQGLRAGARDSDIAADALKEFSIRAVDNSVTTVDGFKSLGLNADRMAARIAAGGKTAAGGLDTVLDRLRNVKDPVERSRIAVELFGAQAEDLGAALFAMDPSTAVAALGKVGGAAATMGDDLTTPQARLTAIKRTLELKVKSWFVEAFDWINAHRLDIADGLLDIADASTALIPALAGVASVGLRVGQALLYAAGAVAYSKGNIARGKELFVYAGQLGTAADRATTLGQELANKTTPAIEAMRRKVAALRSKEIEIKARENATAAAARAKAAFAKLPPRKNVTITAHSSTAAAESSLNYLARARNARIYVTTSVSSANAAEARLGALGHASGGIVGAATGGIRSRLTMVGEHGRELLDLAPGTQVRSNPDTERLLAGSGGGGSVVLEIRSGGSALDDLLVELLRKAVRVRGGNVQTALGRGA